MTAPRAGRPARARLRPPVFATGANRFGETVKPRTFGAPMAVVRARGTVNVRSAPGHGPVGAGGHDAVVVGR